MSLGLRTGGTKKLPLFDKRELVFLYMNNGFSSKKAFTEARDVVLYGVLDLMGKKFPRGTKILIFLIVGFSFGLGAGKFITKKLDTRNVLSSQDSKIDIHRENLGDLEDPIEKRLNDNRVSLRCAGALFNIMDFRPSNKLEVMTSEDPENGSVVSVRGTNNFQGGVTTPFECKLPFVATISATLVSGSSIGLMMEFEDVFMIIVGDGDHKFVKLLENDFGLNDNWRKVFREHLDQPIKVNSEVVVTVMAKRAGNRVKIRILVYKSGEVDPVSFEGSFIPSAVSLGTDLARRFKIGINDSFYRGEGSVLKMGVFSVREGDWE